MYFADTDTDTDISVSANKISVSVWPICWCYGQYVGANISVSAKISAGNIYQ